MAGYGYSYVTERGFTAFSHDLENGAWKGISIKKYDTPDATAKAALADASASIVWKLRAIWGIRSLVAATGVEAIRERDVEWDAAQRAFHLFVGSAEEHKKKEVREAASRVRAALLSGGGTAQTQLDWDQEVDFARAQLDRAAKKPLVDDIKLIGAGAHLKRIDEATKALAKGLGRDNGEGRSAGRSVQVREALTACSTAFNGIHDEIVWAIEHTADKEERAQLEAMLLPFEQLLDRYPPTAAAPAAQPAAPVAPAPKNG